ncbi:MAG: NirD/YgiW/YdeI family stress tolerance protein [Alphaproteobacteria bacterium]|nr:NirD/YgiW/YdeI family stress tolerance protein [Alphaproteobacteria bacterium]
MRFLPMTTVALLVLLLAVPSSFAKEVTKIEDIQRGASVTLQGEVTRILDEDEFRLQDETGSVRVYIGWRNRVMVDVGERVTVKGFVDDDLINYFRPEVYAQEIVRDDGRTIKLD